MSYKNTIKQLNRLHSAEIEMLRYSDPTKLINMDLGKLDHLKKQALDSENNLQKKRELKQIVDLLDHKNYFSDQLEIKKETFMNLVESNELYESFEEEKQQVSKKAQEALNDIHNKIEVAQKEIEKIIEDTQEDIHSSLEKMKEIEINENYLFYSNPPVSLHHSLEQGMNRYIDYYDSDLVSGLDESIELENKKRQLVPALSHIDTLGKSSFKYNNFDTRKAILKGVNK